MKVGLTHDEALDAITGALGVTVLSYQEAIETYLRLRRLTPLFTSQAAHAFHDPYVTDANYVGSAKPRQRGPERHRPKPCAQTTAEVSNETPIR